MRAARGAVALLFALSACASADPIVKPVFGDKNDPHQAVQIVFTGDGYQQKDQDLFDQTCQTFVSSLFQNSPYDEYKQYFTFTSKLFYSEDHGCRRMFPDGDVHLFHKMNSKDDLKTAFGIQYVQRKGAKLPDVTIELGDKTLDTVKDLVGDQMPSMVIMFTPDDDLSGGVNMKADEVKRVAGQMGLIVMTTDDAKKSGAAIAQTLAHELGHAVFGLADEYEYGSCFVPAVEPDQANVTISQTDAKWQGLIDRGQVGRPVPGGWCCPAGRGIFRPTANCRMRELEQPFCRVCRTRISHAMAERTSMIKSATPSLGLLSVGAMQRLDFQVKTTCVEPADDRYQPIWEVDGRVLDGKRTKDSTGDVFELSIVSGFPQGSHKVRFNILDHQPDLDFPNAKKSPTISNAKEWWLDVKLKSALVPSMNLDGSD